MRWPKWLWKPREYVAVVDGLRFVEEALARRREAEKEQRLVMAEVRVELRRKDRT